MLLVLVCLLSPPIWSQETYTSPFTFNVDTGIIEKVSRSIVIDDDEIVIITETSEGKDIQLLVIQGKEYDELGNQVYYCTSKDGHYKTTAILAKNEGAPYLDIIQPAPGNLKEIQHYKILLD